MFLITLVIFDGEMHKTVLTRNFFRKLKILFGYLRQVLKYWNS